MNPTAMITLRVILEDELPIRRDFVVGRLPRPKCGELPPGERSVQRRKPFIQRLRTLTHVDENKSVPIAHIHPRERISALVEGVIHIRGSDEVSFKRVGPRMIRPL